jgi:uncharacterized DUF497 family protein
MMQKLSRTSGSMELALRLRPWFSPIHSRLRRKIVLKPERRWQTIGAVHGELILLVAHTVRDDHDKEVIRIISARKADRKERKIYADQNR